MKCQKCGYFLPEDSEFCQYCGTRLEPQQTSDILPKNNTIHAENMPPAATPVVPNAPAPEKTNTPKNNEKHVFCKKCGSVIDPVTKKCSGCEKQYFRAKTMIPIILFVLILVSSVAFNIVQYLQGKEAIETVTAQTTRIKNLENDIAIQRHTIFSQKKTISFQEEQIASLEEKCDDYDYLIWLLHHN